MIKHPFIILLLFCATISLHGQTSIGQWSDHLIYNTSGAIAVSGEDVYSSTGSSILVYNKALSELKKLSKITGLTETGISTLAWSEENKSLVIGYASTNLDILKNNVIYNIPDINRKYISGRKVINRIRTNGKYAYLACSFGIVVVDLVKKEVFDTWNPGDGITSADVWDLAFGDGIIYAATGNGVYYADLSVQGLSYFANWNQIKSLPVPFANYTAISFAGGKIYVNRSDTQTPATGDYVYAIGSDCKLFMNQPWVSNKAFDTDANGFTIVSKSWTKYFNSDGSLNKTISTYRTDPASTTSMVQAIADNSTIWIADTKMGLMRGDDMEVFSSLNLPGPVSNSAINITSYNGRTIICGGALTASWNNTWGPLQVSVCENNQWTGIESNTLKDGIRALADPDNSNHFFVATWGMGLLEYENNLLVKQYTDANSPLQTIIAGQPYVRICGLAFDKNKNLWITQTGVPGSIKILKSDGTWIVNPLTIDASNLGDITITQSGQKWIVLPRGGGLFVLDDNNTPDNFSDDRYKKITVRDNENNIIQYVYCLAEDLDGNLWVGTSQGPMVYYNTGKVFDSDINASRIKIPRNDGSGLADYLLANEGIASIAIDGANRKWLGTASSGAYLLSPDGITRIKNYNELNSPILSNSVTSVTVDNKTGEVWFGTSKGIQSIRGDATKGGEEFGKVYSFPNPVRENFTGNVTITGLMRDTEIRITDISGNLVYRTVSDGGMATWDLKTYNEKRVSTGVYLVFCASSDGSKACVTKMLVIK